MSSYGRQTFGGTGRSIQVTTDGKPLWKTGGVTLDWTTVAPVAGAPVTVSDNLTVQVGNAFLRYGQVLCRMTSGKYGPYDPAASDGRQNLVKDQSFILNETVLQNSPIGFGLQPASDHPGVFNGGRAWKARILQAGAGAASLAAGPTLVALQAAMPMLQLVEN